MLVAAENAKASDSNDAPLLERECLMVGDRLTTDVAFGLAAGARTMLVLTGCETIGDVERTGITPHFIADSLADILRFSSA
jgi:ribonucleotide monophosphatase NagD (HAD superfamily)